MGMGADFKEFAMKGNVVDMAVGVIVGAAFGKIVSSLVENIIMPPLGMALSGVNFADLAVVLGTGPDGKAVLLKYGAFPTDRLRLRDHRFRAVFGHPGNQPAQEATRRGGRRAAPPRQEVLLEEIRNLLAKR